MQVTKTVLCNLQYLVSIGETKRSLKDGCFNEHRRPILNVTGSYIQHTAVSEHFLSNSHSISHMLLIPIETAKRDCLRKASEADLIPKAKTIEPLGMSKRDQP